MNQSQYEVLEEKILTGYARIPYMPLRLEALRHTLRVVDMISLLDTDTDLWDRRSAALLHDTGRFLKNSPRHATASARLAEELLPDKPEIAAAIRVHSEKDRVHGALAEDLKDADVLARWLDDPASFAHPRLQAALKRLKSAVCAG